VTRERSPEFLGALRVELFLNELEIKRATARAMSLQALADRERTASPDALAPAMREANLKLCELVDAKNRDEANRYLAWWGISESDVTAFVLLLARARRAAQALNAASEVASRTPVRGLDRRFRRRRKPPGERRFCTPFGVALSHCKRLRDVVGVTRVAVITGLGDFGIPNAQATRPDGSWSSTVGSGKSETVAGAKIGAIMEEVEKWAQEQFPREGHTPAEVVASYEDLRRARRAVVDPRTLDLPFDTSFDPRAPIGWRPCDDLIGGKPVLVPTAMLVCGRQAGDILYSSQGARKLITTNGLASGFTLEEAITHALCECIERHSNTLATILDGNPGPSPTSRRVVIPLDTIPKSTSKLVRRIQKASFEVRVLDISSNVRVPTFAALIRSSVASDERLFGVTDDISRGTASHPDPEVALNMALLEAVQNIMSNVAAAREDLTLRSRSLGRHERSASITRAALTAQRGVDAPTRSFDEIEGLVSPDAREDVRWLVERVRDAGYPHVLWTDYTVPEIEPARVVRVIVPGLETVNPFHSGLRARMGLLADLLPFDRALAASRA
jgi:ribosomal protein S12 methylthiotransferase accessory factor